MRNREETTISELLTTPLQSKVQALCHRFAAHETQEDPSLYVAAQGVYSPHQTTTFDLGKLVKEEFLLNEKKVLLLLGESGSGKSLFGQMLVRALCEAYKPGNPIPLFVSLPTLTNPRQRAIEEILERHGFTEEEVDVLKKKSLFFRGFGCV